MSSIDSKNAMDKGLDALEARVDELVRTVERLSEENRSLHARQKSLMAERADLIDKTDMARTRVESMINRLKSMEINL